MGKFLDAAEIILRREKRPMRAREITDSAIELGILNFSDGKTPIQTLKARVSDDIRAKGVFSRFKRVEKGLFALRIFGGAEYEAPPFVKRIKPSEDVLTFLVGLLGNIGLFDGIKKNYKKYEEVLDPENTKFLSRVDAETDKDFKQVLSYVIIKYKDSVLRFTRGSYTSVRDYLKGRYCIGFGGHVKGSDFNLLSFRDSGYMNSIYRELNEELRLPANAVTPNNIRTIGVLNDDSSDLGKVHFAFIQLLELDHIDDNKELKRERSINQLRWIPISKLGQDFERYEYWSKLCIKSYFIKEVNILPKVYCVRNYSLRKERNNIAIVGRIGSGKTEAAKMLEENFGYSLISARNVVQQLLHCSPLASIGRKAFQDFALSFIKLQDGPKRLAETIYRQMALDKSKKYVIDGIRNLSTFELLREQLKGKISVIYVDSTVDNSYEFYKKREEREVGIRQFYEYIQHPVELEIERLIEEANIIIYNQGDRKQYLKAIENFFREELL